MFFMIQKFLFPESEFYVDISSGEIFLSGLCHYDFQMSNYYLHKEKLITKNR